MVNKRICERIIIKVYQNKFNKQKVVTIPKYCKIKAGDYVEIRKK